MTEKRKVVRQETAYFGFEIGVLKLQEAMQSVGLVMYIQMLFSFSSGVVVS